MSEESHKFTYLGPTAVVMGGQAMNDRESAATYFSRHCNKLVNGSCQTTRCLHRGGYISGGENDPHWNDATCEALDAVNAFVEIERLKKLENFSEQQILAFEKLLAMRDAEIAALKAEIDRLKADLLLLAKLSADTPQFHKPFDMADAKKLRDNVLSKANPCTTVTDWSTACTTSVTSTERWRFARWWSGLINYWRSHER